MAAVCRELEERVEAIRAAGVADDRIVLDPGLGFAKTPAHSWALLRDLDPLLALGHPLLVGASRKSFLGAAAAPTTDGPRPRPVGEREAAHLAVVLELARAGVWGVRVHDVRSARDALAVLAAMRTETPRGGGDRR